jgi:DNA-directed RNA polymerase subunit L
MNKVIVKIIDQNKCTGGYSNSNIKLELTGITFHYANMLRRVIKSYVPTYAFPRKLIKVTKNTSIINNDQILERLSNMPIMYINNSEDTVKQFLQLYNGETLKENYFTMFVSYKNKTGKIAMVTTDMAKFYYLGNEIKSPYKKPFLFVKLNNNEEFECTCEARLGLNLEEEFEDPAIYDPVAACAYGQICTECNKEKCICNKEYKYVLGFESKQQLNELEILRRALSCLIIRFEYLNNLIKEKIVNKEDEKEGILQIPNEDMTLGGILGYTLQMHKDIEYAGEFQPNIAQRSLQLKYKTKTNIVDVFNDSIDILIGSIKSIAKQLKLDLIEL